MPDERGLGVILEILPHSRQIGDDLNSHAAEVPARADA
jgi:hypothetical protein